MFKKIYLTFLLVASFSGSAYASADSLRMRTVSSWPYNINAATATATINGHDYLLAGMGGGIFVFNIDSLDAPYKVSEAATFGCYIKDIAVAENYAYLAAYNDGFWIIDISDPLNPHITGNVSLPGYADKVSVINNYAYVASPGNGVRIVDISDPYNPFEAETLCPSDNISGLDINDTLLYIADENYGLKIYNIAFPLSPIEVGHNDSISSLHCVYYKDNCLYAGNISEVAIYDVSDPTNPVITGTGGGGAYRMAVLDTIIYGTVNSFFYSLIDIRDPSAPVLLENKPTDWYAFSVAEFKDRLFVSAQRYFSIHDINDQINPLETYRFECPVIYGTGAVKDSFAYMPSDCIHIIKLSASLSLHEVGTIRSIISGFTGVDIQDSLAYLADFIYGLQVANISDPYNPVVLDSLYCSGPINSVTVKDSFALLSTNGIKVINVKDPASVFMADSIITPGYINQIFIKGNLAYAAADAAGLKIYDISNLPALSEVGSCPTPGNMLYVTVSGNYAYASDSDSGLCIIDVSDSSNPYLISSYSASRAIMSYGSASVAIKDSLVYIAYDTLGVRVINVSDPANPTESGFYRKIPYYSGNMATSATGLTLADNKVYVSYYGYGLQVFEYTSPSEVAGNIIENKPQAFLLNAAYPNPARGKTTISYQLPNKAEIKFNIYNIAGQLVQSVNIGIQQPGYYNVPLKTDKLSSGVYFYKLTAGSNSQTKKFIVLK